MGDGINYLTPSATIAGEFARANLLEASVPMAVRVNGVVAAKATKAAKTAKAATVAARAFGRTSPPATVVVTTVASNHNACTQ